MPYDGVNVPQKARSLMDALELLRTDGWCKGFHYKEGKHCILGALYTVLTSRNDKFVVNMNFDQCRATGRSIADFNDAPDTTFADVEKWFEEQIYTAMSDNA